METGLPGLESQTYGGTASKIGMTQGITVGNTQKVLHPTESAYLLGKSGIEQL
jgi:hypothetical protein